MKYKGPMYALASGYFAAIGIAIYYDIATILIAAIFVISNLLTGYVLLRYNTNVSPDKRSHDSISQDSISQDNVSQDNVSQDSVSQDSVSQDSVSHIKLSLTKALSKTCPLQEKLNLALKELKNLPWLKEDTAMAVFLMNNEEDGFKLIASLQDVPINALKPIENWSQLKPSKLKPIYESSSRNLAYTYVPIIDRGPNNDALLGALVFQCHAPQSEQADVIELTNIISNGILQAKARELLIRASIFAQESDQLKNQFIATMSHEVRTPMNHILGMLSLLLKSELTDKQRKQTSLANSSARSLLKLMNDILDISRFESGGFELDQYEFNLFSLFEEFTASMRPAAEDKHLTLTLDTSQLDSRPILGDPVRIKKILGHLVTNAIKFTHQGEVTIRPRTSLEKNQDQISLTCCIEDTGIGIPASKIDHLFTKFTQVDGSATRAYSGTGIGLAICKNFCELMDGNISVSSQPGKGSQFEFTIQLMQSSQ